MFEKILVCMKEMNADVHIIRQAVCMAKSLEAKLLLYYPLSSTSSEIRGQFTDPLNWSMRKAETESLMRHQVADLIQKGIQAQGVVIQNHNAKALLDYAEAQGVSMMITEKSSNNMDDSFHTLMKYSTIPVLSLSSNNHPTGFDNCFRRVLVPLDGSKRAEQTLPFAAFFSENLKSEVICVHVVQRPNMTRSGLAGGEAHTAKLSTQMLEANQQNAIRYFNHIKRHFSVPVYFRLLVGDDIAASIHQLIEDEAIDLVVLSAHGVGANPKWPYGSIANNLTAYASVPVLLVQDFPMPRAAEEATMVHYAKSKSR